MPAASNQECPDSNPYGARARECAHEDPASGHGPARPVPDSAACACDEKDEAWRAGRRRLTP